MTRDGRIVGNGIIVHENEGVFVIETDYGNKMVLNRLEIESMWHADWEPEPDIHAGSSPKDTVQKWYDDRRNLVALPAGFVWINRPAIVSGEDFSYEAQVLCSFPKLSGQVRYVVEDNSRLFIQREKQIEYTDVPSRTIGEILEQSHDRMHDGK